MEYGKYSKFKRKEYDMLIYSSVYYAEKYGKNYRNKPGS